MKTHMFVWLASLVIYSTASGQSLELNKGDHICIIGNTLAERMQHDGWLETLPHQPLSASTSWSSATWATSADELDRRGCGRWISARPTNGSPASAPIPQPAKLNPDAPVREEPLRADRTPRPT